MTNTKILLASAALAAVLVGAQAPAFADNALPPGVPAGSIYSPLTHTWITPAMQQQGAQAEAAKQAALAQESITSQNFSSDTSGLTYGIWTTNKTTRDIWVTFYKKETLQKPQVGEACIPPGQTFRASDSDWSNEDASVQVEVKNGAHCGGDTIGDGTKDSLSVAANNGSSITVTTVGGSWDPVISFH